jgi:hypothetical protein
MGQEKIGICNTQDIGQHMMHTRCDMNEPMEQTQTQSARKWDRATIVATFLLAAAVVMCLILPGDVPVNGDQVWMLITAANANASHTLVKFGLSGGMFGMTYGPVPTQIYQLLFLITHDLHVFILLRAMLVTLTIAATMCALGRSLQSPPWFIAIVLASPWVWYFCRDPWDNNFALPIGSVLLLAYLRWLQKPTRPRTIAWVACATLMPLVHLSALPLPVAVAGHAMARRWKSFRRALPWVIVGVILACSTSGPWLWFLSQRFVERGQLRLAGYDSSPGAGYEMVEHPSSRPRRTVSMTFAFRQATLLTADVDLSKPANDVQAKLLDMLRPITRLAHLWLGIGSIVVLSRLRKSPHDLLTTLSAIALGALIVQAFIFFVMRIEWHEHYLNGTFASMVLLCWIGAAELWKRMTTRWILVIVPGVACVASTITLLIAMHMRANTSPTPRHIEDLAARSGQIAADSGGSPDASNALRALHLHRTCGGQHDHSFEASRVCSVIRNTRLRWL